MSLKFETNLATNRNTKLVSLSVLKLDGGAECAFLQRNSLGSKFKAERVGPGEEEQKKMKEQREQIKISPHCLLRGHPSDWNPPLTRLVDRGTESGPAPFGLRTTLEIYSLECFGRRTHRTRGLNTIRMVRNYLHKMRCIRSPHLIKRKAKQSQTNLATFGGHNLCATSKAVWRTLDSKGLKNGLNISNYQNKPD